MDSYQDSHPLLFAGNESDSYICVPDRADAFRAFTGQACIVTVGYPVMDRFLYFGHYEIPTGKVRDVRYMSRGFARKPETERV